MNCTWELLVQTPVKAVGDFRKSIQSKLLLCL